MIFFLSQFVLTTQFLPIAATMKGVNLDIKSVLLLAIILVILSFKINHSNAARRSGRGYDHHHRHQTNTSDDLTTSKKEGKETSNSSRHHHNHQHHPPPPSSKAHSLNTYNVLDFGAKGNGITDDTKAFQNTWAAACKAFASTFLVPSHFLFLVGPISFSGPHCQSNILFQLEGTIIAPTDSKAWGSGLLQWIEFTKLKDITIQGHGTIEGRGSVWWTYFSVPYNDQPVVSAELNSEKMPSLKPTALRFYGSYNVTVTGIAILNSPQCHLKFDNCEAIKVYNMNLSSPATSPNTDGIHLQNTRSVVIHHIHIACGDDCVSIQTGCSNVKIHSIHCGPGHGISIGGLGKNNSKACVSNITVVDIDMHDTMTGVRIKTWQGGSGSVYGILFSNIRMHDVQTPIVIDQFYCDRSTCKNQSSAVGLASISYRNIRGTYTVKPVHFACSDAVPCSDLSLTRIQLKPIYEHYHMYDSYCWQAFGGLYSPTVPPIVCLQNGKPASNRILSDHDIC